MRLGADGEGVAAEGSTPRAQGRKMMRGMGRVFRPIYRDKRTGEHRTSAVWWIQFSRGGKTYRESAETTSRSEAVERLKVKLGRPGAVSAAQQRRMTLDEGATDYLRHYEVRALRSGDTAKGRVEHLKDFFGADTRMLDITTDRIIAYQLHRRQDQAEGATINRETAALARMFTLAVKAGKLAERPAFPDRLTEAPPRQGFFELGEYRGVRAHLPFAVYRDVLDFGYYSGWRRSEITGLTWAEIDWSGGIVRLSPDRSKSEEPRLLPISRPVQEVLRRRLAARRLDTPLVFHHGGGQPVGDWRKAWQKACTAAKCPDKLFHDLRRTVVRNLLRSGTPEGVAMRLTGHKTRSVFERYNIVSEADLRQAVARLADYVSTQAAKKTTKKPAAPAHGEN